MVGFGAGLGLVGVGRLGGFGAGFVRIDWGRAGWRAGCGLMGFGLLGWGWRRPCVKGTVKRGGLVIEETETGGVTGCERGEMTIDEVMILVKSGSNPTRGILFGGFTLSDGSLDASFPGSELVSNTSVDVVQEGSVTKLFYFVTDIGVNGGGDGCLEVVNRRGLAADVRFEVIETGSEVGEAGGRRVGDGGRRVGREVGLGSGRSVGDERRGLNVVGAVGVGVGVGGGERGAGEAEWRRVVRKADERRGGVVGRTAPELRVAVGDTKVDGAGGKDGAAKSRKVVGRILTVDGELGCGCRRRMDLAAEEIGLKEVNEPFAFALRGRGVDPLVIDVGGDIGRGLGSGVVSSSGVVGTALVAVARRDHGEGSNRSRRYRREGGKEKKQVE